MQNKTYKITYKLNDYIVINYDNDINRLIKVIAAAATGGGIGSIFVTLCRSSQTLKKAIMDLGTTKHDVFSSLQHIAKTAVSDCIKGPKLPLIGFVAGLVIMGSLAYYYTEPKVIS